MDRGPVVIVSLLTAVLLGFPHSEGYGAQTPGTTKTDPTDGQAYVWVPPGSFLMGCVPGDEQCDEDEKPRHQVTLTKGFWMGNSEVTVEAYERFADAAGHSMPPSPAQEVYPQWSEADHPIVLVTWYDARDYCTWAGGRLPREAEWEYAARGGKEGLKYPSGDKLSPNHVNCLGTMGRDQWQYTCPVRGFPPSRWGLYGLTGNVWEWVSDWYDQNYYTKSPSKDPGGPFTGNAPVLRGGSFSDVPESLRVSDRSAGDGTVRRYNVGFRCVLDDLP